MAKKNVTNVESVGVESESESESSQSHLKSSTTGTPKSIFARIGEFGSGQGPKNEEEAIFNAKQTNKKKKKSKAKNSSFARSFSNSFAGSFSNRRRC